MRVLLAIVAAAVLVSPAYASPPRTLHLVLPGTKSTYVDLNRKGYSAGDYFMSTGRLLDRGTHRQVGKLGGIWTILSRNADNVTIDLGLADGTIFVAGHIVHTAPSSTLTITGGTGRYHAAHGAVTFRYLSQTSAGLDVRVS